MSSLFYGTVTNLLKDSLITLMKSSALTQFRLVGGTALSLQIGHRISVDIDFILMAPVVIIFHLSISGLKSFAIN
ncbi:nucleotidyl transferase AbiEii/AbiGii toxin family protein [Sphingobacterium suaedae]|uniref:Nucleotidyl transferase AbiEii/AbiGii toxin family protein n=1 Tax=Sphingobacterium suaedae TaxID=1686402 RepID=A0ABW5KGM2_9SPHI